MRAAYDKGPPPYDLVIGWLCDRLHKTPEQIEECDLMRLLRMTDLMGTYEAFGKHIKGEKLSMSESVLIGEILQLDLEQQGKGQ